MGESLGIIWQHIDLFFYRKTSQADFLKDIKKDNDLTDFAKDQLSIVRKLIDIINPKIILIANAEASKIFKESFKDLFNDVNQVDNLFGTYLVSINNRKVPLFLSSMLSNGATDNESYNRLKWHIGFVNKKL